MRPGDKIRLARSQAERGVRPGDKVVLSRAHLERIIPSGLVAGLQPIVGVVLDTDDLPVPLRYGGDTPREDPMALVNFGPGPIWVLECMLESAC